MRGARRRSASSLWSQLAIVHNLWGLRDAAAKWSRFDDGLLPSGSRPQQSGLRGRTPVWSAFAGIVTVAGGADPSGRWRYRFRTLGLRFVWMFVVGLSGRSAAIGWGPNPSEPRRSPTDRPAARATRRSLHRNAQPPEPEPNAVTLTQFKKHDHEQPNQSH